MVERQTVNLDVPGSSPGVGASYPVTEWQTWTLIGPNRIWLTLVSLKL
jgi:hypothetical protein